MKITLENTNIEIESNTVNLAGQLLKRVLHVVRMEYNIENKCVSVEGIIRFEDEQEQPVQTHMIRPYIARIQADQTKFCDLQGNTLCAVQEEYITDEETEEEILNPVLIGTDYMTEFEWFYNLASNQPVVVNQIIIQFLTKALNDGRFN